MSVALELPIGSLEDGGESRAERVWRALSCRLLGHYVDNREFAREASAVRRCRCGDRYLATDGSETRIRHTVSCFAFHHSYVRVAARDGHHEYVCVRCGHPLLFRPGHDPYARVSAFDKKVRYLCNLFGHRVHTVCDRNGFTEYACGCGHSFLRAAKGLSRVTHPLVCLVAGHFVRFVESRDGYAEYRCRNCGHTFSFVDGSRRFMALPRRSAREAECFPLRRTRGFTPRVHP
jgi:uncharacterized C2H2 Zn-finger protein